MPTKAKKTTIKNHKVVSEAEWLKARQKFLVKEKNFMRVTEAFNEERRALPWVKVTKNYEFDGPNGKETLADLFEGRSQLIIYHHMFTADQDEGCPHCALRADCFDGVNIHLKHRDTTMICVSRAPYKKLAAYKKRMGWVFKWVSSGDTAFNFDYHVSFREEERKKGTAFFNYGIQDPH